MRPSLPSRFLHEMRGETERARRIAEASAQRSAEISEQAEKAEAEKLRKSAAASKKRSTRAQPSPRKRGMGQDTT
jgi:uncharacterized membrane protein YqiK